MTDGDNDRNDNDMDDNVRARSPSSPSPPSSDSDGERELGRHDYWESTYERELETLLETGDEGEVWFGSKVNETVADFCAGLLLPNETGEGRGEALDSPVRVIDVGCGNGALLLSLALRGFGDLTGSDYSERALALARAVVDARKRRAADEEREQGAKKGSGSGGARASASGARSPSSLLSSASFSFVHDDATDSGILPHSYDAATDKGTLDAVGLSSGGDSSRRAYLLGVSRYLRSGGTLVVTSVNSTLEELRAEVEGLTEEGGGDAGEGDGGGEGGGGGDGGERDVDVVPKKTRILEKRRIFEYVDHVRTYPVYSFGGRSGARVATVAFRKKR